MISPPSPIIHHYTPQHRIIPVLRLNPIILFQFTMYNRAAHEAAVKQAKAVKELERTDLSTARKS